MTPFAVRGAERAPRYGRMAPHSGCRERLTTTATTVVPAAAMDRRYEDSFERAVLQSERLLVSEMVTERLDGLGEPATPHGAFQVKGREQPVQVYELA